MKVFDDELAAAEKFDAAQTVTQPAVKRGVVSTPSSTIHDAALKTAMVACCARRISSTSSKAHPSGKTTASPTGNWPRGSRISCGARCRMTRSLPPRARRTAQARGAARPRSRACCAIRGRSASPRRFRGSGCNCASVGMFPPDKKLYPDYDDYLEKSMVARDDRVLPRGAGEESQRCASSSTPTGRCSTPGSPSTTACPASTGDDFQRVALQPGGSSRRTADAGGDPEPHLRRHAASAGASRQVGAGVDHRQVAAAAARPTSSRSSRRPPTQPKATLRMKLDAHKSDANCAACHRKIDPLGLAFDNYDAIGRWRTEEVVERRHRRQSEGRRRAANCPTAASLPTPRSSRSCCSPTSTSSTPPSSRSSPPTPCAATMTFDDRAAAREASPQQSKAADYRLAAHRSRRWSLSDLFQTTLIANPSAHP